MRQSLRWLLPAASIAVLLAVAGIWWYASSRNATMAPSDSTVARFVAEASCRGCHASESAAWEASHHALAMQVPTPTSVLGDFKDRSFAGESGVAARFFGRNDSYWIRTTGPDGHDADFPVQFTFGVDPLQQYLLALPGGRLQAFSLAWDTQTRRWFDLNAGEQTRPGDALHWTGAAYNWNFMCAECHSTDVRKNYAAATHSYQTTYAALNVGCQSCHGPASAHVAAMQHKPRASTTQGSHDPMFADAAAEINACAYCHSRRSALGGEPRPDAPLLDTHVPALLVAPLYYADGQIEDEVFEYGSFLQSRMHAQGVRCSDCHEPHGLGIRSAGNAVCTSCHNPVAPAARASIDISTLQRRDYDSPAHHFHVTGQPGSRCVDCHMPTRTYMRVDDRHDHSLRIPRPDLSIRLGTPNACNGCHRERSAAWAADAIARWYGPERRQEHTWGEDLWIARQRAPGAARALATLLADAAQPAIVRATALDLLRGFPAATGLALFSANLAHADPLIRLQAVKGFELLPVEQRPLHLESLLADPIRSVRMEAARLLAGSPLDRRAPATTDILQRGIAEYVAAQRANADRPEAHLNLGNLYAARGDGSAAEREFAAALRLDERFSPAIVNLADLQASQGEPRIAEETLRSGLARLPDAASLHHALGLILIRQGKRDEALIELQRATQLAPDNPRHLYVYAVAQHDIANAAAGIATLHAALKRFPNDRDLLLAVASYARAAGDEATAQRCLQRLRSIEDPGDST